MARATAGPIDRLRCPALTGPHRRTLRGARIHHAHLQVRDDFTAFHVGLVRYRPAVESGVAGLFLAGDWVRLPCPAMLMEAACTAGLLAANAVLAREGLRALPVYTVPPRGILA